jgi:hypothetical protein
MKACIASVNDQFHLRVSQQSLDRTGARNAEGSRLGQRPLGN